MQDMHLYHLFPYLYTLHVNAFVWNELPDLPKSGLYLGFTVVAVLLVTYGCIGDQHHNAKV